MSKLAVVAIGGNSLIKDNKHQSVEDQYAAVVETCGHIVDLIEQGWRVVITHGNGPQVGFILIRSEMASNVLHTVPLDSCGADTQGAIGYQIQQALHNEFRRRNLKQSAATVVTQVVVDKNDPSFQKPSKPIGPFYEKEKAERCIKEQKWDMVEDAGRGWRRVVASPLPLEIVEENAIRQLVEANNTVIAVGGGGIPVIRDEQGDLHGTAAVIDKDFASGLLAANLKADLFIISTAVERAAINFNKPNQENIATLTLADAKKYLDEGHFAAGSMGPKIKAVIRFLEQGGKEALITNPESLAKALKGETGTRVVPTGTSKLVSAKETAGV